MRATFGPLLQRSIVNLLLTIILSLTNLPSLATAPYKQLVSPQNQASEYTENFQNYSTKESVEHTEWDVYNHTLQLEQKDGIVQLMPAITPDGFGEYYITWVDFRFKGDPEIFTQKMDANGNRLWQNDLQIVADSGAYIPMPKVKTSVDIQGNLIILWWGDGSLHMQKIDRVGKQLLGENGQIIKTSAAPDWWNTTYSYLIDTQGMIYLAKSNYYLSDSSNHTSIEKFTALGDPVWPEPSLISIGSANTDPSLIWDASGNMIIVWRDYIQESQYSNMGMYTDILAQKVNTNGKQLWNHPTLVVETPNNYGYSVIQDNNSTYIAWMDYAEMDPNHPNSNSNGIYAQKLDGQGNPLWASRGINITHQSYGASDPYMKVDAQGNIILGWLYGNYSSENVFLDKITPEGLIIGSQDVLVNTEMSQRHRESPSLALNSDGSIYVIWADREVYFQRLDSNGNRLFKSDVRVNEVTGTANQDQPILGIGGGNTYLAWIDDRDDHSNVYLQRLAEDGSPLWDADIRVNSMISNQARYLRIIVGSDGNAVIAWQQEGLDPRYTPGIFVQKVDAQGNRLWKSEVELVSYTVDLDLQIILDQSNNIYAFWTEYPAAVYGQKISPEGEKLSSDRKRVISVPAEEYMWYITVTYDPKGYLWVGYSHQVMGTNSYKLTAQRIMLDLSSVWPQPIEFDLNHFPYKINLNLDSQGNAILVWSNFGVDVEAQKINPNGTALWAAPHAIVGTGWNLIGSWVDAKDDVWLTYLSTNGINIQHFTQDGQPVWTIPVQVSQALSFAEIRSSSMFVDGQNKAWIVWSVSMALNAENSDSDIFIQAVNDQGNLEWPDSIKVINPERFYNLNGSAESRKINPSSEKIQSAILTAEFETNGGSVEFYLSNDGGKNWAEVTPGVNHTFAVLQSDLRWKAELQKDSIWPRTPVISSIHIEYSSLAPGSDDYEPDDNCMQAQPIETLGAPQQHNFHAKDDVDWVWFTADLGTQYTVQTAPTDSVADTAIDLYTDCFGQPDAQDDSTLGGDARLTWSATQAGPVYIRVRSSSDVNAGTYPQYGLSIRAEHPSPVAVIVVGGTTNPDDQTSMDAVGDQAYQTFLSTGMSKSNIRYFGSETGHDSDGNGQLDDIFGKPIKDDLRDAIQDWSREQGVQLGVPFYLVIVGPGEAGRIFIDDNGGELTTSDLYQWLNNLEATSGADQINVIIEAPKSGSFIQPTDGGVSLSKARRVIITSTSNTGDSFLYPQGSVFMTPFFSALGQRKDLKSAFDLASAVVQETKLLQMPWMDGNGDSQPDGIDQNQVRTNTSTGTSNVVFNLAAYDRGLNADRPRLPVLGEAQVRTVEIGKTAIQVKVHSAVDISQVWALIYPIGNSDPIDRGNNLTLLKLTLINLLPMGNDVYQAILDQAAPEHMVFYATDISQNISIPLDLNLRPEQWQIYLPILRRQ